MTDPVTTYARHVIKGKILTGELVRLACQRHIDDLKSGLARGLRFDKNAALRAIDFFPLLQHSQGEWAGGPFNLESWQKFIVGSLFGWKRADGTRRFRTAYNEIARKNGKSTISAGVGLYLFDGDDEPGAQVYTAATKRDQARIVHSEAVRMVKASPALRSHIRVFKDNLNIEATASKYEPLGADSDTLDGLNVHGSIIDELHAHKNSGMVDILETATGARRQPLNFEITTAGYDRHSICWQHRDYSEKVLRGIIQNDAWFAYIATMDKGDRWDDEACWGKANPNLGVSVKLDGLRDMARKAAELPSAQNAFRQKHLNEWTEQAERWLPMDLWDEGATPAIDLAELAGKECWGGLDLASVSDIASLCLVFPDEVSGEWTVLWWNWVPREGARRRADRDRVPYFDWAHAGQIIMTDGDVTDYDVIRDTIKTVAETFNVKEIAYDRWNASQLVTQLTGDGLTMVPTGMGYASMNAPSKELETLIVGRKLKHGGDPVARWAASNVTAEKDAAGNTKPSKGKSTEKIDPIVALVLAISRAMVARDSGSVYETRGIRFLE